MTHLLEGLGYLGIKASTLLFAIIAGLISVLIDWRKHTALTAILAVIAGALMAVVATDPIVALFKLSGEWSNAIAAVLGISGRNLVVFISKASKDPLELWDRWRGK